MEKGATNFWKEDELTLLYTFIENREQKQQNSNSDVFENQTGNTDICAELTDSEIQPDHQTSSNDADTNLPKSIADPENITEIEKETIKGKIAMS